MPLRVGGEVWKLRDDGIGELEVLRWGCGDVERIRGVRVRDAGAEVGWRRRRRLGCRVSARWSIVVGGVGCADRGEGDWCLDRELDGRVVMSSCVRVELVVGGSLCWSLSAGVRSYPTF